MTMRTMNLEDHELNGVDIMILIESAILGNDKPDFFILSKNLFKELATIEKLQPEEKYGLYVWSAFNYSLIVDYKTTNQIIYDIDPVQLSRKRKITKIRSKNGIQ